MKVKKYVVLWHEDNDSGIPKHVMGSSPAFDTGDEAKAWIAETVCEDRARWDAKNTGKEFGYDTDDSEGIVHTYANYQHTYYKIEEIEWEDRAAECVEEVESLLKPGTERAEARVKRALIYIDEHRKDWLPLREWAVDIRFCPASCVHRVRARTADEAERIVDDMIDNRTLGLTDEQKAEMMDCLLENVESVEAVGPEDE